MSSAFMHQAPPAMVHTSAADPVKQQLQGCAALLLHAWGQPLGCHTHKDVICS